MVVINDEFHKIESVENHQQKQIQVIGIYETTNYLDNRLTTDSWPNKVDRNLVTWDVYSMQK